MMLAVKLYVKMPQLFHSKPKITRFPFDFADMESLPTLNDLQAALLNDPEAEEELLSVVIHLLVCAIDDPGIPTPHKHLTLLGQNLRQADITNTNVSEILKIYLTARGQVEVKNLHGVTPPETHSLKDRSREIPFCQKRMEEFNRLLKKTRAWEMAQWVKERPFLCLNPTEKGEILAFVCNELLFNKSVMHQIESNVEGVNKAKKVRLVAEARLRKLKHIQARKVRLSQIVTPSKPDVSADNSATQSHAEDAADKGSELASNAGDAEKQNEEEDEDDKESVRSESVASESNQTPVKKKRGRPRKYGKTKYTKKKKRKPEPEPEPEEEPEEEPEPEESEDDLDDLENEEDMNEEELEKLTAEEITKKVERATRLTVKSRDDLVHISNCLRVNDLGQDRYRRRYWHFAHAGGVFVEGIESGEPWKLPCQGMPHEKDKLYDRKRREEENEEEEEEEEPKAKVPKLDGDMAVKSEDKENAEQKPKEEEEDSKDDAVKSEEDKQRLETQEALKKLGHEILVTPKTESDKKSNPASTPKVTPNGDKLNLFNHSAHFHMTLSPVVLNGSVTITPKNEPAVGGLGTSTPVVSSDQQQQPPCPPSDKPWFSLLPLSKSASIVNNANNNGNSNGKEHSTRFAEFRREKHLDSSPDKTQALLGSQCPVNPQIALLELKLKELRKTNFNKQRKPIPDEYSHGWWRIEEVPTMIELERKLNIRGTREQLLLQNSKRNLDFMHEMVHAYPR